MWSGNLFPCYHSLSLSLPLFLSISLIYNHLHCCFFFFLFVISMTISTWYWKVIIRCASMCKKNSAQWFDLFFFNSMMFGQWSYYSIHSSLLLSDFDSFRCAMPTLTFEWITWYSWHLAVTSNHLACHEILLCIYILWCYTANFFK